MKAWMRSFARTMFAMSLGGACLALPAIIGADVSYAGIVGTSLVWAGCAGLAFLIYANL